MPAARTRTSVGASAPSPWPCAWAPCAVDLGPLPSLEPPASSRSRCAILRHRPLPTHYPTLTSSCQTSSDSLRFYASPRDSSCDAIVILHRCHTPSYIPGATEACVDTLT